MVVAPRFAIVGGLGETNGFAGYTVTARGLPERQRGGGPGRAVPARPAGPVLWRHVLHRARSHYQHPGPALLRAGGERPRRAGRANAPRRSLGAGRGYDQLRDGRRPGHRPAAHPHAPAQSAVDRAAGHGHRREQDLRGHARPPPRATSSSSSSPTGRRRRSTTSSSWPARASTTAPPSTACSPDFMAQGGDPTGTGRGGPGYQFRRRIRPRR